MSQIIGYTTGVFDLFHIGHLNILQRAKDNCDYLIVGVTIDELLSYKGKAAVIPFEERMAIVGALKCVDQVVAQTSMDKLDAWDKYHFHVMFHGSDWQGTEMYDELERKFKILGVEIIYFPYTQKTSSTKLQDALNKL